MSYVASVLQPGERIIRLGSLHWIVYWHAILFFVLAVFCAVWASTSGVGIVMMFCAMAFGLLTVVGFGVAWFKRWTTEIAITDRREKELSDLGFLPLVHCKNTDYAAFFGGQSCQKAKLYNTDSANANARLSTQLPYIFSTSRSRCDSHSP